MTFKKRTIIKISLTVLTFLVLALVFGYYNLCSKYDSLLDQSNTENRLLQNQFDEILNKYDSLSLSLEKEDEKGFENAVNVATKDAVKYSQMNQVATNEKSTLENQINSLKSKISKDSDRILAINKEILEDKKVLIQLESYRKNEGKSRHDKLNAINLNARGVKILSDLYSKTKSKNIQQIRVCFTLEGNEFVRNGNKQLYVQVVNPKNQIISVNDTYIELEDVRLNYSAKMEAFYNKRDLDVCTYVDLEADKTIKGKYIINIYNSFSKIGTTIFEYE